MKLQLNQVLNHGLLAGETPFWAYVFFSSAGRYYHTKIIDWMCSAYQLPHPLAMGKGMMEMKYEYQFNYGPPGFYSVFKKTILLILLLQLSHFFPLCLTPAPCTLTSGNSPTFVHVHGSYISSLASPFHMLFLTSSCLFCTYLLGFLFPVLFFCSPPPTHH